MHTAAAVRITVLSLRRKADAEMDEQRFNEVCEVVEALVGELGTGCGVDAILAALPASMHAEVLFVLGMAK